MSSGIGRVGSTPMSDTTANRTWGTCSRAWRGSNPTGDHTAGAEGTVSRKDYLVGLDVGTSRISAIAASRNQDGGTDVLGMGVADAHGIRRGFIASVDDAVASIRQAVEDAERTGGLGIDTVHLALSGAHVEGVNCRGVVAVSGKNGEITQDDVRRAIGVAASVTLPPGREVLQVIPQRFLVDEQDWVVEPVGMTGVRLEANVHVVTGRTSAIRNIVACVERAGLSVTDTVVEQYAASEAVLTDDEKELGVALLNIGAGSSALAIFDRGAPWHTAVIDVGGDHFTNDVAVGLRTPMWEAESLKCRCGCALTAMVDSNESIAVASIGRRPPRVLPRRLLAEILQPRAEEIFWHVRREIHAAGCDERLNAGVVLTGGGALLPGMEELAEMVLTLPIRRAGPEGLGGLEDHIGSPAFATVAGVVLRAHRQQARVKPRFALFTSRLRL
jgi:cell division protein FtsA